MREATTTRKIKNLLANNGWLVLKIHGGVMQTTGIPDIIAIKNGKHVWIEVKAPRGRLTKRQEYMIQTLRSQGAEVITAWCVEDVGDALGIRV